MVIPLDAVLGIEGHDVRVQEGLERGEGFSDEARDPGQGRDAYVLAVVVVAAGIYIRGRGTIRLPFPPTQQRVPYGRPADDRPPRRCRANPPHRVQGRHALGALPRPPHRLAIP